MKGPRCPGCGADLTEEGVYWEELTCARVEIGEDGRVHVYVKDRGAEVGPTKCSKCNFEVGGSEWIY
jgi:hypothetical protein